MKIPKFKVGDVLQLRNVESIKGEVIGMEYRPYERMWSYKFAGKWYNETGLRKARSRQHGGNLTKNKTTIRELHPAIKGSIYCCSQGCQKNADYCKTVKTQINSRAAAPGFYYFCKEHITNDKNNS